jgi:hypothetical protein
MLPITLSIVEDLDEVREGLSCYLGSNDEFLMLETFEVPKTPLQSYLTFSPILSLWTLIFLA